MTDEITGAIADAVNYAVEQLRELVTGINNTASRVAQSAENTREAISRLAEKANEQAGQVGRATEKIQTMAGAFTNMAEQSKGSSDTANALINVRQLVTKLDVPIRQVLIEGFDPGIELRFRSAWRALERRFREFRLQLLH